MKKVSILLGLIVLFTSCSQTLEEKMNHKFSALKETAELGTVEYTIKKIIKANDETFYSVGDRKILMSCRATMKAGIDLAKFNGDSVIINEEMKSVALTLPKPEILAFNLPAEEIKLEYEKVGTFRFGFTAEERNNLLKQGEEVILADAANLGILQDAEVNARLFFESLLRQVGFESINIEFK